MIYQWSWSSIAIPFIVIFCIKSVSSAPLSLGDKLNKLKPAERQFYRLYCGVWNYMPHKVVSTIKPAHRLSDRIVDTGATQHCLDLTLKVDYASPKAEEIQPLKQSKLPIVWVLGGPASGKGSVCAKFAAANSYSHISVGDLLRAEVQNPPNPAVGKMLQETMNQGQLVPSYLSMNLLIRKMLSLVGNTKGFLIDGFPRSLEQGVTFQSAVRAPDVIVFLDVSEDIMKKRTDKRQKEEGRADDNDVTFKKRINVFKSQTEPVITSDIFKSKVVKINSEGTIEETAALFSSAILNNISKQ